MIGLNKAAILIIGQKRESKSAVNNVMDIVAEEDTFEVHQANNWQDGFSLAYEIKPDVIICDGSIPGPGVRELSRNIRSKPELVSTVLIIFGSRESIKDIQKDSEASIDDWVEESAPSSAIIEKIKTWLRAGNIYKERLKSYEDIIKKNNLLQTNFKELTIILVKILDTYLPGINDNSKTAKAIAEYISEKLNVKDEEKDKIVFGAFLHEIGKVGLPRVMVEKAYHDLSMGEKEVFSHHPSVGSMIISSITGFKNSANAVYHQLENYDGSGMPDGLMGDEIPIGAKIIRAIVLLEELYKGGFSSDEAIGRIKESLNKALDPFIADHLITYLEEQDRTLITRKTRFNIGDLKTGMVLAEDVYSASGIKLLPKGVTLQEKMIKIIAERNSSDPIIGGVYVFTEQ